MSVTIQRTTYRNFGNCVKIFNNVAELYVTLDFGPRVIHYSMLDAPNMMFTNERRVNIKQGCDFDQVFYPGAHWNIYGGNRLWVSPEVMPDTFYPDHEPVDFELAANGALFTCQPQIHNKEQLSVRVTLDEVSSQVYLNYSVKNVDSVSRSMAAWSVTALDAGGSEIIPHPAVKKGVLPNRLVSLWDYSDMHDPRVLWGKRFIVVRHDPKIAKPFKVGINNVEGWACYINKGYGFICRYEHNPYGSYHDFGASYESFVNGDYIEMESVGPLQDIAPGKSATHDEVWELAVADTLTDYSCEKEIADFIDRINNFQEHHATKLNFLR